MAEPAVPDALTAARQGLDRLEAVLKSNPGALFSAEYYPSMSLVRDKDPARWTMFKKAFRKAGVAVRDVDRALATAPSREIPLSEPRPLAVPAGSQITDCPKPDLLVPAPYHLEEDATIKRGVDREGAGTQRVIAYAPLILCGRLRDVDEGTESLRVGWRRGGRWSYLNADRGKLLSSNKLLEFASQGFPVADTTAKDVVGYLNVLEAANYEQLPATKISSHLGWQGRNGDLGFLWGRTLLLPDGRESVLLDPDELSPDEWPSSAVAFRGLGPGDDQLARGFHAEGDYAAWLATIRKLENYPKVLMALYASFVPPLLQLLRAPNFSADWANRSSTGKTTALRVAGSIWGNPDERSPNSVIHTWDATKVWIERAGGVLSGLPLLLDDTKLAKRREVVGEAIYSIGNGQGRGRGSLKSLSASRSWYTVMLSTGESPATSFSQDGGSRMRCLEIRGIPFGREDAESRSLVSEIYLTTLRHFGHAGPRFVQYLQRHRDKWPGYVVAYQNAVRRLTNLSSDPAAGRLASYAAAIESAALLAHDALELPWAYPDTVRTLWHEVVGEASDAAGERRALMDVVAIAHSRQDAFHGRMPLCAHDSKGPSGGWLGRWDYGDEWKDLAFFQPQLRKILTTEGYDHEAILTMWQERGWLDHEPGRRTKSMRAGGGPCHMIVLRRSAVDDIERGHRGRTGDGSGDTQEDEI